MSDGKVHSRVGASSAERYVNCPASVNHLARSMERKSSVYADEGSAAHALCDRCITEDVDPQKYEGWYISADGQFFKPDDKDLEERGDHFYIERAAASEAEDEFGLLSTPSEELQVFEVDADMVSGVRQYRDYIKDEVAKALKEYGVAPMVLSETSFDLSHIHPDMFGTNDALIFIPGKLLVIVDFKYGRGKVVEVEANLQLLYYALGALHTLIPNLEAAMLPDVVRLTVVQPRARHKDGPVRTWDTDAQYVLEDYRNMIVKAIERTRAEDAPYYAGDWCQFCAKATCPELKRMSQELTKLSFADLTAEDAKAPAKAVKQDFNLLPDHELSHLLEIAPIIDAWVRALESEGERRLLSGTRMNSWKLVERGTKRKIVDPEAAQEALEMFFDRDQIMAPQKLKTPAQLEKLGKDVPELIKSFVTKPRGKLTVAHASDPREAVEVQPDLSDALIEDLVGE